MHSRTALYTILVRKSSAKKKNSLDVQVAHWHELQDQLFSVAANPALRESISGGVGGCSVTVHVVDQNPSQ